MSSGSDLYMGAKLLTSSKHLKVVSTYLMILEKKTASSKILMEISSYSWCSKVTLCECKFTGYRSALQNLAYLQIQDFLVNNHHTYRSMY